MEIGASCTVAFGRKNYVGKVAATGMKRVLFYARVISAYCYTYSSNIILTELVYHYYGEMKLIKRTSICEAWQVSFCFFATSFVSVCRNHKVTAWLHLFIIIRKQHSG